MGHRPERIARARSDPQHKARGGIRYAPTGIPGFDEITGGGLPAGRITVVLGGAGGGKTIFGLQALVAGARDFGEPGVFVAFEESARQVFENTSSFAWGIERLSEKSIAVVDARLPQSVIQGGEFDLLGLLAVLGHKVKVQHRVASGTALRFIRVAKCRGGPHSANEFPFTIGPVGIEVGAGAATEMIHPASTARVSSGVERLDAMLGGGYYRGSSTLITGSPGTSKTTLSAAFAEAASRRKERTLFVSFDEAPAQIARMDSVGIPLGPHVKSGVLRMHSLRSQAASREAHAAKIRQLLREHRAVNLVVDPLSALGPAGGENVAQRAAIEVLDLAKRRRGADHVRAARPRTARRPTR